MLDFLIPSPVSLKIIYTFSSFSSMFHSGNFFTFSALLILPSVVYIPFYMCVCVCICIYVYICMYICVCVYITHICICVYIHTHTIYIYTHMVTFPKKTCSCSTIISLIAIFYDLRFFFTHLSIF